MIWDIPDLNHYEKVTIIQSTLESLQSALNDTTFNKYMVMRIKQLRDTAHNISELIHRDEIVTSPKRKLKKSRIVFDKQVDLMLIQAAIKKLEQSVIQRYKRHIELMTEIKNICLGKIDLEDEMEQLNIIRLVSIYSNEVDHLNEYFENVENHKQLTNLTTEYTHIINDNQLTCIVNYFQNLSKLCDDLNELHQKLIVYEQQEQISTNAENSHNNSQRSKSQTFELSDQMRKQVLKEITNQKEQSSDTCINCIIF